MTLHTLKRAALGLMAALSLPALDAQAALPPYNLTQGVTAISHDVFRLHMEIFWICVAIGIVVFGVMLISIFKHRKSVGHKASQFHESTKVEIIWTVIPFAILVGIAIPASQTLIAMESPADDSELTIKVTGYQWKWQYEYLDQNVSFYSNLSTPLDSINNKTEKGEHYLLEVDNPLVLPAGKKVRILLTSNDVIHSWWVPDFAIKQDAIPGFVHEKWVIIDQPGTYRGQCAELCGRGHGFMPIVVQALPEEEFKAWLQAHKAAPPAQASAAAPAPAGLQAAR